MVVLLPHQASKTFQAFRFAVARAPMITCIAAPGQIRMFGVQVEFGGLHAIRYASGVVALCMGKESHVQPTIAGTDVKSCGVIVLRDGWCDQKGHGKCDILAVQCRGDREGEQRM